MEVYSAIQKNEKNAVVGKANIPGSFSLFLLSPVFGSTGV
jgi:hypothetical protein